MVDVEGPQNGDEAEDFESMAVRILAEPDPPCPPLFEAVEHMRIEEIRQLIAKGADVNSSVRGSWTPLVHAIDIESDTASQAGLSSDEISTELVELLLAAGAQPTEQAFELAAAYKNHKALALLRKAQAP